MTERTRGVKYYQSTTDVVLGTNEVQLTSANAVDKGANVTHVSYNTPQIFNLKKTMKRVWHFPLNKSNPLKEGACMLEKKLKNIKHGNYRI